MSFTDQKQRKATKADLQARWGARPQGERFRCYLCGHKFEEGDLWRWVYAGGRKLLNFLVCDACDGEDVLDRWEEANANLKKQYWWALESTREEYDRRYYG